MIKSLIRKLLTHQDYNTSALKSFGKGSRLRMPLSVLRPEYITIGEDTSIFENSRLDCWDSYEHHKLFPKLQIGNRCDIGYNFSAHCTDELIIGDDVLIASYVLLTTQNHGMNVEDERSYQRQPLYSSPIHIESGVWIGEKVTVLPGVTIGEKSIIGANSVVTKNVPPFCIAVGIPAKVIKKWDFDTHCWRNVKDK